MSAIQAYVVNEMVAIPVDHQGSLIGNMAATQEVIAIALMGFIGAWSDRVGRRFVLVLGFLLAALGYLIYPYAGSVPELYLYRIVFSVGATAVAIMYSALVHDTCQEVSRAKWVAFNSVFTGLSMILVFVILTKLPQWYQSLGSDPATAGRYSLWTFAAGCVFAAMVLASMLDRRVIQHSVRSNLFRQVADGLRNAIENPRLAVAYGGGFIGRGDLVIISTFLFLWCVQTGLDRGMTSAEGLAKGGMLFGIVQAAALAWTLVMGLISDRVSRTTALCIALTLATVGYLWIGQIDDPFGVAVIPAAIALGIGEVSVLVAAGALVGQESTPVNRGVVIGIYGLMGGLGILFATLVGGQVFDRIGQTAPFTMMGLMNFLLLAAAFTVRRRYG